MKQKRVIAHQSYLIEVGTTIRDFPDFYDDARLIEKIVLLLTHDNHDEKED